ncbi:hypothetical protein AAFF_G00047290 [Aldrovandia affinis]|uniref:Uncharacterized protein n=1 Tax=Aldrovandia affinis TaxID=143900 RepID=A0AAD7S1N0_9TELE|nr:hypothetical protein AAFF_G00047290 [Aldrovandia affinis]
METPLYQQQEVPPLASCHCCPEWAGPSTCQCCISDRKQGTRLFISAVNGEKRTSMCLICAIAQDPGVEHSFIRPSPHLTRPLSSPALLRLRLLSLDDRWNISPECVRIAGPGSDNKIEGRG